MLQCVTQEEEEEDEEGKKVIQMLMNGWRNVLVSEQQHKMKPGDNLKDAFRALWEPSADYAEGKCW